MELKYHQYRIGTAKLIGGEMHASLHEIEFDDIDERKPFIKQIYDCITTDSFSSIVKKHIQRGINIGDEKHTRLIESPDFPIRTFEPGYFNLTSIEFGLSGGDICFDKPDLLVESYFYFWETIHPFSQWHKCEFEIDGVKFNSAEQYMMFEKAKLFSDFEIAKEIIKSKNVREQKKLGQQVAGFNKSIWESQAPAIVYAGNKEKFRQNNSFKELLLSTKGKTVVEASPNDCVWGIGLAAQQDEAKSIMNWKGTNWLGIVLTELREEILADNFESRT